MASICSNVLKVIIRYMIHSGHKWVMELLKLIQHDWRFRKLSVLCIAHSIEKHHRSPQTLFCPLPTLCFITYYIQAYYSHVNSTGVSEPVPWWVQQVFHLAVSLSCLILIFSPDLESPDGATVTQALDTSTSGAPPSLEPIPLTLTSLKPTCSFTQIICQSLTSLPLLTVGH